MQFLPECEVSSSFGAGLGASCNYSGKVLPTAINPLFTTTTMHFSFLRLPRALFRFILNILIHNAPEYFLR